MKLDKVRREIERERSLERRAKKCTRHFTKKVKRVLFEEIDNMVWSGDEEISKWCQRNKVYDEITEDEIEEIWNREGSDDDEPVRLNGKYVWETAKRVCDFINAHDDLIHITSFGEYRVVMLKVMRVVREAHNVEQKRRQTSRKKRNDEAIVRTQKAKALIAIVKRGGIRREEIGRRLDEIFGNGSGDEINNATTTEKIVERIEELSKRETQFEEWETRRQETRRRQIEDKRLNAFWRRNETFPVQYGGDDETPDPEGTLAFWRSINNKEVTEGWRDEDDI